MGEPGTVYLVGAGPGHPGLLTLRAVECLRLADLVLYDRLVPPELLDHAPASARRLCVDEFPGCHPERWPHIHRTMIEEARQGRTVVRLKGGDPFVFGRGAEEALALREAGVPYEVVPGVTAALGATACAGVPVTHRDHASAVAFVTGHEQPGKPGSRLDWSALARFPGTLVFYMPVAKLEAIAAALVEHGKPADTPAAIIHRGTTSQQRTLTAPLAELPARARAEGITSPSLVVVGEVVGLRERLAWFERRPLFRKRVLVTRPRHQAGDMVRQLEAQGASAVVLPAVEIGEPADWGPVDRGIARLADFTWLVFTSANGVKVFFERLRQGGRDLRALARVKLAAIGPATAEALRAYHLEPDLMPTKYNSEGLAAALRPLVAGGRLLLARADRGLELLREELSRVADVEQVAVYSQRDAALEAGHPALEGLAKGEIDYVTLTSTNIARALLGALDARGREEVLAGRVGLVTISPRTSAAVREAGLPVAAEAAEYTTAGVVAALCRLAGEGVRPGP